MKKEKYRPPGNFETIGEPFRTAVKGYIADCQTQNFTPSTVFGYSECLRWFFEWLTQAAPGVRKLADLTRQVLSDYQMYLWKAESKHGGGKLSISTQHDRLAAVLRLAEWLLKEERILINPGATIQLPKLPKRLPRNYLSAKEMNRLLSACDLQTHLGLRNRAILETMYSTAIRNMELRNLTLEDLNTRDGYLTIRRGKGDKDRVVPVGKASLHFIDLYLEKSRPVFVGKKKTGYLFVSQHGEKLHADTLNQIIDHAAKKARLKRKITAHGLRHTCATQMLRGRADIRHIQELLGHRSLASTQIYTRVEISDLKRVHQQCHPREKEAIDKK